MPAKSSASNHPPVATGPPPWGAAPPGVTSVGAAVWIFRCGTSSSGGSPGARAGYTTPPPTLGLGPVAAGASAGVNAQVAPAGRLAQASSTGPVKPLSEETPSPQVALCPCSMLVEVGGNGSETLKSGAAPGEGWLSRTL